MTRAEYIKLGLRNHLNDKESYRRLTEEEAIDLLVTANNKIKQLVWKSIDPDLDKANLTYLKRTLLDPSKLGKMYLTAKVHKSPLNLGQSLHGAEPD